MKWLVVLFLRVVFSVRSLEPNFFWSTVSPSGIIMSSSAATSFFDSSLVNGLGGLSHGSFFRIADSVDNSQSPGSASVQDGKSLPSYWKILSFQSFLYSPNLTWLLMASLVWQMYPYPLSISTGSTHDPPAQSASFVWRSFLWKRLIFNILLSFVYIGFWHITLYTFHWCKRPFVPHRQYNPQKVLHNMWYTTLGVLHWMDSYRSGLRLLPSNETIAVQHRIIIINDEIFLHRYSSVVSPGHVDSILSGHSFLSRSSHDSCSMVVQIRPFGPSSQHRRRTLFRSGHAPH
jgi:hypothetical protein